MKTHVDSFEQLLYVNTLRGDDATGMVLVEKNGDFHICKQAVDGPAFIYNSQKEAVWKNVFQYGVALIGHNRKGTMGGVTDKTAHPFVIKDRFAMVHNGTLYDHKQLANTEVDSEALAMVLEEVINSPDYTKEKLEAVLQKVYGAYALIWYNQESECIQILKNNQRSLFMTENEDAFYIASEWGELAWILGRNGIKGLTEIKAVEDDALHTFELSIGKLNGTFTKEKLDTAKKSIPPAKEATHTDSSGKRKQIIGDVCTKILGNGSLSKNEFKRYRNNNMGKAVEFWIVDYVESALFETSKTADSFIVMGESGDVDFNHLIKGTITLRGLNIDSVHSLDSVFLRGQIQNMEYNNRTHTVEIYVTGIKQVAGV